MEDRNTLRWRKSSRSQGASNCVEIAQGKDQMLIRDSKNPNGPVLMLDANRLDAFVRDIGAGRFGR